MTTVIQLLDHLIKAAGDMGKLKDPIPSTLIKARARIEHLEAQLAATETMRDRIAMQMLPGIMERGSRSRNFTYDGALRRAFGIADLYMLAREQGSAGVLGETTSPNFRTPTEAMVDEACKVCIGFSGDHGTHNDYLDRDTAVAVLTAALQAPHG